jgi:hypothetical protein
MAECHPGQRTSNGQPLDTYWGVTGGIIPPGG